MSCPSGNCPTQGPNVRRLILRRMSLMSVGEDASIKELVDFLKDAGRLMAVAREAESWARSAIIAARPFPDVDTNDEAIAGEILKQIDEKKG